MYQIAIA